jgi:hypothetical protein
MSVSTLANATLIENGDYSTDTESGLDWLDWSRTVNKTQSEALAMFSVAGWRPATGSEARVMIENYFNVHFNNSQFLREEYIPGFNRLSYLFELTVGATHPGSSFAVVEGYGAYGVRGMQGLINEFDPVVIGAVGYSNEFIGVALVKASAVSEPAIITLFALGFVGIGFARRRQS